MLSDTEKEENRNMRCMKNDKGIRSHKELCKGGVIATVEFKRAKGDKQGHYAVCVQLRCSQP